MFLKDRGAGRLSASPYGNESAAMDLDNVRSLLGKEHGLAVLSTTQADGRILSSVVNCGVIEEPVSAELTVALVSGGHAARLNHIRRGSEVTLVVRRSWHWIGVTGPATLIGPNDPAPDIDTEQLRILLRSVFAAAGGEHDNLDEFDRVMAREQRTCVFVRPDRIIGNPV
jgi:PPOX class probable F420-dependent enzyme